jgi:hypothetical protein
VEFGGLRHPRNGLHKVSMTRERSGDMEKSIGELLEEVDLKPSIDMLVWFMLETKKQNGDLYHHNM